MVANRFLNEPSISRIATQWFRLLPNYNIVTTQEWIHPFQSNVTWKRFVWNRIDFIRSKRRVGLLNQIHSNGLNQNSTELHTSSALPLELNQQYWMQVFHPISPFPATYSKRFYIHRFGYYSMCILSRNNHLFVFLRLQSTQKRVSAVIPSVGFLNTALTCACVDDFEYRWESLNGFKWNLAFGSTALITHSMTNFRWHFVETIWECRGGMFVWVTCVFGYRLAFIIYQFLISVFIAWFVS